MSMRELENRAANIGSMLRELVIQGEGARSLVRQAMLANGQTGTRDLERAEAISCTPELYVGVCKVLSRWIADVHRELQLPVVVEADEPAPRALPPGGRR